MAVNALPSNFRGKYPSSSVASYSYEDIAEGTGIQELNCFVVDEAGTYSGVLDKDTITSQANANPSGTYQTRSDIQTNAAEFKLSPFNMPKVVRGTMKVALTFIWAGSGSARCKISVMKNTTELAYQYTATTSVQNVAYSSIVPISVPLTNFKKGDYLSIKIKGENVTGTFTIHLMHDTLNRDFTATTPNVTASTNHTNLKCYIPFRIDT